MAGEDDCWGIKPLKIIFDGAKTNPLLKPEPLSLATPTVVTRTTTADDDYWDDYEDELLDYRFRKVDADDLCEHIRNFDMEWLRQSLFGLMTARSRRKLAIMLTAECNPPWSVWGPLPALYHAVAAIPLPHQLQLHTDMVRMLLDLKAQVNLPDKPPILHYARTEAICEMLIAAGADVNARYSGLFVAELSPLYTAVACNRVNVAASLLRHRANVSIDLKGMTVPPRPIMHVAQTEKMYKLLAEAGADVNAIYVVWRNERTPLYIAVQNAWAEAVPSLLAAGADATIGDSPLSAIRNGNASPVRFQQCLRLIREFPSVLLPHIRAFLTRDTAGIVVQYLAATRLTTREIDSLLSSGVFAINNSTSNATEKADARA